MRIGIIFFWILALISLVIFIILRPEFLHPEFLAEKIRENRFSSSVIYFLLIIVLGFFISPNSPVVLAGALVLGDDPFSLIILTMSAIIVTAILIYYFSRFLNIDEFLNRKYSKQYIYIQEKLNKYGFFIISGWSFLPLVSTDIMCYACGVMRIPIGKFLIALTIGETIRICLYVFTASGVVEWLL